MLWDTVFVREDKGLPTRGPDVAAGAPISVIGLPFPIAEASLPAGMTLARKRNAPELIIVNEVGAVRWIQDRIPVSVASVVPIVEATSVHLRSNGTKSKGVDHYIAAESRTCFAQALSAVAPMVQRLRALPPDLFSTPDRRLLLLARLFVRGRGITPVYDVGSRAVLTYRDGDVLCDLEGLAEALVKLNALRRHDFATLAICSKCRSARNIICRLGFETTAEAARDFHCLDCGTEEMASAVAWKHFFSYSLLEDTLETIARMARSDA